MSRGQAGAVGRGSGEVTGLPQTLRAAVGPQASSGRWWEPRHVSVLGVGSWEQHLAGPVRARTGHPDRKAQFLTLNPFFTFRIYLTHQGIETPHHKHATFFT